MLRFAFIACVLTTSLGCQEPSGAPAAQDDSFSPALFANPPEEHRPQTRWWWPGASVEDDTLRSHLRELADVGYGAVEIQPFMAAITNADLQTDARIRAVGDLTFLDRLRTAACAAKDLGLVWDLTLGSGWSTGGVGIDDDGSRQLIAAELDLEGPSTYSGPLPEAEPPSWIQATNAVLPAIDGFDEDLSLVSALGAEVLEEPGDEPTTLGSIVDLTGQVQGGILSWEVPTGSQRVFAIYENRTRHFPAGGAYSGTIEEARIIDHLDRRGIEAFLESEFEAWIEAVADCPPRAVFVDSFELVGELPWTTAFGSAFEASLGYDVALSLPFLFREGGESGYVDIIRGEGAPRYQTANERGVRAREDYEAFRSTLFEEELIRTLRSWLHNRGIDLRLQAHGGYGDVLDGYAMADVPESEGLYGGGSYDFLRLSASAAHVAGKRHISNETFVSLGASELTEEEVRLVAGRAFSAGINRLMHHGNAYPYTHQDGQRWFPFQPLEDSAFTTGPVDLTFDIRPEAAIWTDLPALNRMAARLSYTLSRGSAVTEVAWLYPRWDAVNFPNFGVVPGAHESETSKSLRAAGFSYDRISRSALAASSAQSESLQVGPASYKALLIEGMEAADPDVLEGIQRAAEAGVAVIWIGEFPVRARGLIDADAKDARVRTIVEDLQSVVTIVSAVDDIPSAIAESGVTPLLGPVDSSALQLSTECRNVTDGHVCFLFNESYEARTGRLRIDGAFDEARLLDPDTGESIDANPEGNVLTLTLPAARGVILHLIDG